MKTAVEQHLHDIVIGTGRLYVLPAPVPPLQPFVELVQGKTLPQPRRIAGQRVLAIAGIAAAHVRPLGRHPDGVPQSPNQQIAAALVAVDDVTNQSASILTPGRMVVAVDRASLRISLAGVRRHSLPSIIDHPQVGVFARQPLGAGTVSGQHHVEPDVQSVLFPELEHAVKIIELVYPRPRFHPVPIGMAADDAETRPPDPAQIIIPHILARRRSTVVLYANRKSTIQIVLEAALDSRRVFFHSGSVNSCCSTISSTTARRLHPRPPVVTPRQCVTLTDRDQRHRATRPREN